MDSRVEKNGAEFVQRTSWANERFRDGSDITAQYGGDVSSM